MSDMTSSQEAATLVATFEAIRARGGHAALDFCDGQMVLQCAFPDWGRPETWGQGEVPPTRGASWVRLMVC